MRVGLGLALLLLAAGCEEEGSTLAVDLRTDFVAGVELASVRTTLDGESAQVRDVTLEQDVVGGIRVAEFAELRAPEVELRVALLDEAGAEVASRPVRVSLSDSLVVTVLVTRQCRGVTCPGTGDDPGATACVDGTCRDPRCVEENGGACGTAECTDASDCTGGAACTSAECVSGRCFYRSVTAMCGVDEFCSPEEGCQVLPGSDAGPAIVDAGPVDAGPGDAGPPVAVSACTPPRDVRSLALGETHSCVLLANDELWCWGQNGFGQITGAPGGGVTSPVQVAGTWTAAASGQGHICAIRDTGSLECWGRGLEGQLGQGDGENLPTPTPVGTDTDWTALVSGRAHICALRAGRLFCWGNNSHGQTGQGDTGGADRAPVEVLPVASWERLDSRWLHMLGIRDGGELWGWGLDREGNLGIGGMADTGVLNHVEAGTTWSAIRGGGFHSCAIRTDGSLWCAGANTSGQLGQGDTVNTNLFVRVGADTDWVSLGLGRNHSCGIRSDGTLHCWGGNGDGQLGLGSVAAPNVPTRIGADDDWIAVQGGEYFTCGIRGVDLYCWGANASGQLGLGDVVPRDAPALVCF